MNRNLLLVPILAALAACSAPTPSTPAQPDAAATPTTEPAATPTPDPTSTAPAPADSTAQASSGSALPEGMTISGPYQLIVDHVVTNNDGLVRRQVSYSYPNSDAANTSSMAGAMFTSAGFKPRPPKTQANGDIVMIFDKGHFGASYAIIKNAPADASAPRQLMLDFPGK